MAAVVRSRSYLVVAIALAALVLVGFARTFYLRYWFDVPPITKLSLLHGLVFSAWFALFVVQARFIAKQDYRTHQKVGIAGMVLAALVFLTAIATAIVSATATRPRPLGMTSPQFVLFPISGALAFGGLVAAAYFYRRRPQIHKRLMMLAMVAVLGPPVARVLLQTGLSGNFIAWQTTVTALFAVACLAADWVRHRTVHPIYVVGGTLLTLMWPLRAWFARTPAWEAVGNWLAKLGTFAVS